MKAPELSQSDVRAEVERLYEAGRDHHLFAFYGRGQEDVINGAEAGRVFVRPVQSELDLRVQLGVLEDDARVVFLVPWTDDIPLDLVGRFALRGRVHRIGVESRLKRMFDVREVEAEARDSPLARYLLEHKRDEQYRVTTGRLGEAELWSTWLRAEWSIPLSAEPALDSLLGWAAHNARGAEWSAALSGGSGEAVVEGLDAYLRRQLGPAGGIVWRAWLEGRALGALELALALEAVTKGKEREPQLEQLASYWRRVKVKAEFGIDDDEQAEQLAVQLSLAAGGALRTYQRDASRAEARTLLERADARVDDGGLRGAIAASTRLPSAWQARLDAIGAALSAGAAAPEPTAVAEAKDRVDRLVEHIQFQHEDEATHIKRATMAVRLLAWLAARPDEALEAPLSSYGEAVRLGRWYAEEGGYVDWARSYARGGGTGAFHAGIEAVVHAADTARQVMDRRYAEALADWCAAGRPGPELLPIDKAIERIAVPFLDADEEHRLLVLLVDGMAWAQAVELLTSLGQRAVPWGPLRWHQSAVGKLGDGAYPAVVTTLPSETEVSRAAFFAGKPMRDGKREKTSKDVERWRSNKAIQKYFEDGAAPTLFLRSDGHTSGGAIKQDAITHIENTSDRIVALVINAIDASLKGDPQHQPVWNVDAIQSLAPLLDKAREMGRSVLFASDHGHVPSGRMVSCKRDTAGASRWRTWQSADETLADGELGFRGSGVQTPKGAHGVVLWSDDAHRYGGSAHAGDHGGATLAETIAPCLLIGPDGEGAGASARAVSGAYVPSWWVFDVREAVAIEPDEPVIRSKPKGKPKKPENPNQLKLLTPDKLASEQPSAAKQPADKPTKQPKPSTAANNAPARVVKARAQLAAPLRDNELLLTRAPDPELREQVLRAVDFLLARGMVATKDEFAGAMGGIAYRVQGLVSVLQAPLNVDSYSVLWFDHAGQQVRLDKGKLEQLFEVKL